jgi:hypothetical protein
MEKVEVAAVAVLRFIGITLLIDLGLFALVSISCLIGTRCTNLAYGERMFWVGMASLIAAMPVVLSSLSTSRGYYDSPFTAGQDAKVALTIVKDGRLSLDRRSAFAWRASSVGAVAIAISAVIDTLGGGG